MIGKTIFKYRLSSRNPENKDEGLRALVLAVLVIILITQPSRTFSQTQPSIKAKVVDPSEGDIVDDNDDGEDDARNGLADRTGINEDPGDDNDDNIERGDADSQNPKTLSTKENQGESTNATETPLEEESQVHIHEDIPTETIPIAPLSPVDPPSIPVVNETPLNQMPASDYVEVIPKEKTVEVELRKSYKNYRERRTNHGFLFNFNAENVYFPEYTSILDEAPYEDMFGQEDLTLLQFNLAYKFNFFLGALTAGIGYGHGTLIDDRFTTAEGAFEERHLTISKKSVNVEWMLDSLMKEPYFVPYVGMSYWQLGLSEENKTTGITNSHDTGYGTSFTVGFLVQLNWIEPASARAGYMEQGLENTYLDVFWTQYQDTDSEIDPVFANDFNFGVGLRLEF